MTTNDENISSNNLNSNLFSGKFGIEIEEHRVQTDTLSLSQHPHPASLGKRKTHPYFQTDFSESQEEVVTAVQSSSSAALQHLHELQFMLTQSLQGNEFIWPLSMPPYLREADIIFLKTHFERPWYQKYRDVLFLRYGPFQHIMTGIHVNFSPEDSVIKNYANQHALTDYVTAKNKLFFQIAHQIAGYRWLLTYLFGAAPVNENSSANLPNNYRKRQPVRSWRASNFGFTNQPHIDVNYTDFNTHIKQLTNHITNGDLYDKSEFYGPVRLRASGSPNDLRINGADYLEFRMFDINPFTVDGISQDALSFLHLLIIDAIINPENWEPEKLRIAKNKNHLVALQPAGSELSAELKSQAYQLLSRLTIIAEAAPEKLKLDFISTLNNVNTALKQPNLTISGQLVSEIKDESLMAFGRKQGIALRNQRQSENSNDIFERIPKQIRQSYIQAHQLGFNTTIYQNNQLKISDKSHTWLLSQSQDLTQLMTNQD